MKLSATTIILAILAILPAIALLIFVFRMDMKEREPIGMVLSLFGIGCVITVPVYFAELGITSPFTFEEPRGFKYAAINAFLCAALCEEGFKYLGTYLRGWKSKHFNCSYDGIVYAIFVSLGFALVENVLYVVGNGFSTAIVRALTAVPGHMCFAVYMGYFMGLARRARNAKRTKASIGYRILSFIVPFAIHGMYDFLVMIDPYYYSWAYVIWVLLLICMFFFSFRLVIVSSKEDEFIRSKGTPTEVTPWTCVCGKWNTTKFCTGCGAPQPQITPYELPQ